MTFRDDDAAFLPNILDEMNIVGEGDRRGADFGINCRKCGHYLTTIKLNPYCTIDIRIECKNCGNKAEGRNLWAGMVGKK